MAAPASDATAEVGGMTGGVTVPAPAMAVAIAPHPELLPLATVRGTDIGNAIHAVFEHRAIGVPLGEQHALIERCLDDAGVRRQGVGMPALVAALARRLQSTLEAPLGLRDAPALRLADVPEVDLRAEMEFTFVLDAVAMAALHRACARHGEGDLVPHGTRVLSGLMNGKIDLLFQQGGRFHVLDYKGNYLGDTLAAYQGEALRSSMDQHRYRFQALIYTVAADRYLRQRLGSAYRRERHLGECVYLFVRAAGLAPDAGIWRHRFPDALLTAVGEVLGAHGHAGEVA
jgi:exodeoxyribonuclease V beta subunit